MRDSQSLISLMVSVDVKHHVYYARQKTVRARLFEIGGVNHNQVRVRRNGTCLVTDNISNTLAGSTVEGGSIDSWH